MIDYTRARLGSGPRGRKIERCPSCGRKGQMVRMLNATSGGRPIPPRWRCTHAETVRTTSGMRFSVGHDTCTGMIVDGECRGRPPR
jgi:hypothetical protein